MKNRSRYFLIIFIALTFFSRSSFAQQDIVEPEGAYSYQEGATTHLLLFSDGYYSHSAFDEKAKAFKSSDGGLFKMKDGNLQVKVEFDSEHKEKVDSILTYITVLTPQSIELTWQGKKIKFPRIDKGDNSLAGTWRIYSRMVEGKFSQIPPGSRKTIKILTGTKFQWIAIDPQSKEFFGTGGGSFTFANGKYTEKLEFFPRDNTKVGTSLTFDDRIEGEEWYHTGKSSAGAPVFEIWKPASVIIE